MTIDRKPIELGAIEFHTRENQALIDDFYLVVENLRDSSSIVDLWLMDITTILDRHGYEMIIYHKEPTP